MFSSVSDKLRSFIFQPTCDQEIHRHTKKRKRETDDTDSDDPDIQILSVKRPKSDKNKTFLSFLTLPVSRMAEWVQRKTTSFADQFSVQRIPEESRWRHPPSGQQHHSSSRPVPVVQVPTSNGGLLSSQRLRRRGLHSKEDSASTPAPNVTITRHPPVSEVASTNGRESFTCRAVQTDTLSTRKPLFNSSSPTRKFTAFQCVRLDERERYRQLLQHYTSVPLTNNVPPDYSSNDGSLSNDRQKFSLSRSRISIPNGFLSETSADDSIFASQLKAPQKQDGFPVTNSVLFRRKSPMEIMKTAASSNHSICIKSPTSVEEDDRLRKVEEHIHSERRPSLEFKTSPYLEDDWIKNLKARYSSEARERQRKIEEAKITAELLEEKRKAKEHDLERQIRERMKIFEKEPPVLPEPEPTEEEEQLPELSAAMEEEINRALRPHPSNEILSDGFRLQISRKDMVTLSGLSWLNDEIINFYMNLLMSRAEEEGKPKVYAFNTFFYPKVMNGGQASVKRWTRKVDIFSYDYILIPVHLGMHWCLAVIDFKKKSIFYYDSMGGTNPSCLNALKKYLCDESLDKKKQPFDLNGWKMEVVKDIPQQMNGSDCGMFACKFADYITREAKITFSQEHMPYFRRRMVYEIIKKKLLQ
ncbi:sentrin-specific protease 1-like [Gigantopelta aegis]|uniref:sentrin-specific protease 1-like n=1 Tax=Gigantopelta aegis TaxID=1735272 RepID=UPI001B88B2E5|nr:sentrin-specific protease 1-like [Gigantopelta aegis]